MAVLVSQSPPCVLREDEHLLVVNKPPGLNTHSPSPYAGEGIYDWLRNREPRWAHLAIIHRLDKVTSGVIVFAKSKLANQSLTQQFTDRRVRKEYQLLTSAPPPENSFAVRTGIARAGERYIASSHGEAAETQFRYLRREADYYLLAAEPLTGRTHQIRVHAEERKIPILGDTLYGGNPFPRVCLHAREITFTHPATGQSVTFGVEPDFFAPAHLTLRAAFFLMGRIGSSRSGVPNSQFNSPPPVPSDASATTSGTSDSCPEGTIESSPAFQRRVREEKRTSPEGTTEQREPSAVPSGLRASDPTPGVETPGYFQPSLRDAEPRSPQASSASSVPLSASPWETTAFRLIHGAADDYQGTYVDRWNDYLLLQTAGPAPAALPAITAGFQPLGIYLKRLSKEVGRTTLSESQPQLIEGTAAPDPFEILENGVSYEISFNQGYSVGLFLDQRDNRRRLLTNYVGPNFTLFDNGLAGREILNTFSYTCAFSVCAALAGARTTSLDLSKKYLEWGKRNFRLNNCDPAAHDFIFGDVFDWAPRLARKGRQFDLVILDPPTFSRSKAGGIFQAEKHYAKLVSTVLPLLAPGGILFASTNAHQLPPEDFLAQIRSACGQARRKILQEQYIPQPPDFPVSKAEPAYLKTVWLRIS